jgi:hypothetical protein
MANSLIDAVDYFQRLPGVAEKAAQLAINTVANRSGLTMIRRDILNEVAFPRDYLTPDRLRVSQKAVPGNLEAVITARQRPTSLARFATSGTSLGSRAKIGVQVQVKRGTTSTLKTAWLVRLRNGNTGLAIRLKPGMSIGNRNEAVKSWLVQGKVALLYGPSVDQVFRDVSEKTAAPIARMATDEFFRQFHRLSR